MEIEVVVSKGKMIELYLDNLLQRSVLTLIALAFFISNSVESNWIWVMVWGAIILMASLNLIKKFQEFQTLKAALKEAEDVDTEE